MSILVGISLLALLAVAALALVRLRNLFAVAMMAGIYSLLSASLFVVMDAVDVAFTEAAVGAGISTILMLGAMSLVGHEAKPRTRPAILPFFVVLIDNEPDLANPALNFPINIVADNGIIHTISRVLIPLDIP